MQMVSLLLVALAVSLDSFSVGFTYGLRKMKIPLKAIIVIACCSGAVMFLSMLIGGFLTKFFPVYVTEKLGGLILVGIGAWVLYQFFRPTKEQDYLLHENFT